MQPHPPRLLLALALLVAACGAQGAAPTTGPTLIASPVATDASSATSLTPDCSAPARLTAAQAEGPYYTPGAPERSDLREAGMNGTPLTLSGFVVTADCTPIARAKVDIWQADAAGQYDNVGYRLRGYVLTDANGAFTIRTIVPGEYPGRTEHIHVKVTPPGGATLTTQLYFPGVAGNSSDGLFVESGLLAITEVGDGVLGTFTFVVAG